jgi:hypothetical protein
MLEWSEINKLIEELIGAFCWLFSSALYHVDIFNDWALYVGLCYICDVSEVTCLAGWIEINKTQFLCQVSLCNVNCFDK